MTSTALASETARLRLDCSIYDTVASLQVSINEPVNSLQTLVNLSGTVQKPRRKRGGSSGNERRAGAAMSVRYAATGNNHAPSADPEAVRLIDGGYQFLACWCGQECVVGAISARQQPFLCSLHCGQPEPATDQSRSASPAHANRAR